MVALFFPRAAASRKILATRECLTIVMGKMMHMVWISANCEKRERKICASSYFAPRSLQDSNCTISIAKKCAEVRRTKIKMEDGYTNAINIPFAYELYILYIIYAHFLRISSKKVNTG